MGSYLPQALERQPWVETPLVESSVLSRAAGCHIYLKLENLQPGSSFKSRGIGYLIQHHFRTAQQAPDFDPKDLHCFSSSGGNAGLACVTASSSFGLRSTVVVPLSTPQSMIIKIKAAGASEVIRHGEVWAQADQYLRNTLIPVAEQKGERAIYVPPFDDPLVWEGASSMVDEIKSQMPNNSPPNAIVCSVGGGGLFAGIMQGLDRVGWNESVNVIAVETTGADSLSQSVAAGQLITLPCITSIAKSLGASQVAERAFEYGQRPNVQTLVLNDCDAVEGAWRFADDERMLVEPACGVSVALAYRGRLKKLLKSFSADSKVVIVICGGSVVSLADMVRWQQEYACQLDPEEDVSDLQRVPSNVQS